MYLLRDVVARKKLVVSNYWLDNYTVEGAQKQLQNYLDDHTRGRIFKEPDAIVYLVDDFYKFHPLMQPFDDQLDITWEVADGGQGYSFFHVKVTII